VDIADLATFSFACRLKSDSRAARAATRQADCHTSVAAPLNPCGFAVWRKMKTFASVFESPFWNCYQAMSWIAYGQPKKIDDLNARRLEDIAVFERRRMFRDKWLKIPLRPNLSGTKLTKTQRERRLPKIGMIEPNFKQVFLDALLDGSVTVLLEGKALPAECWIDKHPAVDEWGNYHVRRDELLALKRKPSGFTAFEAAAGLSSTEPSHSVSSKHNGWVAKSAAEAKCQNWLYGLMIKSPARPKDKNKDDFWKKAEAECPGLKRRAFDRAWKEANIRAEAKWDSHGKKPRT
jgi:hypothetical protein